LQPIASIDQNFASIALTAEDVQRLLTDTSPGPRVDMTDKIAGAYGQNQLTDRENLIAEQIFRLLIRDTELQVRVTLAQHVKKSEHIPHDIVMALARDVTEVALPMLQYSQVLTDNDLADLIQHTEETARLLAMSQRGSVSDRISDRLMEKGGDEVAATLVRNPGAQISEQNLAKVIERLGHDKHLMTAISTRPKLPITTAEKLIHVVSAGLAEQLKQKYQLPSEHIEKEVEKTRETETLGLVRISQSQEEIEKLIAQLMAFGRLSPSLILSGLCQGNFNFFETSLARLSGIPVANARTLITDRGELGFRAIYNKSGLPEAMFPAVKMLLRVVRELDGEDEHPGSGHYANRIVERLLQYAEENPVDNLSYIIALVRRIAA
jgi:uncharacterized protein (DUF2336 family)